MALSGKAMRQVALAGGVLMLGSTAYAQDPETACDHEFTRGTGPTKISYCVNADANLVSFYAGGGEHIRFGNVVDGYTVCSSTGSHGHDMGGELVNGWSPESAWGPNVLVSGPTSSGVRYARTTADGKLRIEHAFKLDSKEHDVTVTVKVTNIGTTTLENLSYKRVSDFDARQTSNNFWTRGVDEVGALDLTFGNQGLGTGISMNAITFGTTHFTSIGSLLMAPQCGLPFLDGDVQRIGAQGDYAAYLQYDLGTLAPGRSRTVEIAYKRQ